MGDFRKKWRVLRDVELRLDEGEKVDWVKNKVFEEAEIGKEEDRLLI